MLKKYFIVVLSLLVSTNVFSVNAGKKKVAPGPTQYRANTDQVLEFFLANGLDFKTRWSEYAQGQLSCDDLKTLVKNAFDTCIQRLQLSDQETVWTLLITLFGDCAPSQKWTQIRTDGEIGNINKTAQSDAWATKKTHVKFVQNHQWSPCCSIEACRVVLSKISETLCEAFDAIHVNDSQEVPPMWMIVTNIKAGKDQKIVVIIPINVTQKLTAVKSARNSSQAKKLPMEASKNEDDHWEDVQQSANCPVKAFMLGAGALILSLGIIEAFWV